MNNNIKQVYVMEHDDLEELAKEKLGLDIDIPGGEFHNGSYLSCKVTGDPNGVYDAEESKEKIEIGDILNHWDLEYVMNLLAEHGEIPTGDYIITIWW